MQHQWHITLAHESSASIAVGNTTISKRSSKHSDRSDLEKLGNGKGPHYKEACVVIPLNPAKHLIVVVVVVVAGS